MIELHQVCKQYGSGELLVQALDTISLTVEAGELCAVMGSSGSGKSTLMNILGCLDRPSSGEYWLDFEDVSHLDDDALAAIRNQKLGFVFQQFHLLPQLNAKENVMLPMTYAGVPYDQRKQAAEEALTQVGLEKRMHHRPMELSGGQQQRVAIARAIVNHPVVLLADEPTGALDSRTSQEILHLFQELNHQGMTIILVTHSPEVGSYCQRIIEMQDGKLKLS